MIEVRINGTILEYINTSIKLRIDFLIKTWINS